MIVLSMKLLLLKFDNAALGDNQFLDLGDRLRVRILDDLEIVKLHESGAMQLCLEPGCCWNSCFKN